MVIRFDWSFVFFSHLLFSQDYSVTAMAMIRKCKKRKFDETKMFYSDSLWWEFRHILNFKLIVYFSIFKSWILMLWLHLSQGLNVLSVSVTRPCIPVYTYFTNEYWQDWEFSFCVKCYISRSNLSLKLFFCNTRCMGTNIDIHIMKASANINTLYTYIQTAFL